MPLKPARALRLRVLAEIGVLSLLSAVVILGLPQRPVWSNGMLALCGLSLIVLLLRAGSSPLHRTGFALTLVILLYSFGENLEMLAYITWPAWAVLGLSLSGTEKRRQD